MKELFENNDEGLLNIFYTAGFPKLDSTVKIAQSLDKAGVKLVEIGMPYSDPLADGETIQNSSEIALENGMNLDIMFEQIEIITRTTDLTLVLMGYLNQMMMAGFEKFLKLCKKAGVQGLIIPDLPLDIYEEEYRGLFEENEISISFLVTPRTTTERIREIDRLTTGFVYLVADNSITGNSLGEFSNKQIAYFENVNSLNLNSPRLIGFGIKTAKQFEICKQYANGAIIGSEFIRQLSQPGFLNGDNISKFIKTILSKN